MDENFNFDRILELPIEIVEHLVFDIETLVKLEVICLQQNHSQLFEILERIRKHRSYDKYQLLTKYSSYRYLPQIEEIYQSINRSIADHAKIRKAYDTGDYQTAQQLLRQYRDTPFYQYMLVWSFPQKVMIWIQQREFATIDRLLNDPSRALLVLKEIYQLPTYVYQNVFLENLFVISLMEDSPNTEQYLDEIFPGVDNPEDFMIGLRQYLQHDPEWNHPSNNWIRQYFNTLMRQYSPFHEKIIDPILYYHGDDEGLEQLIEQLEFELGIDQFLIVYQHRNLYQKLREQIVIEPSVLDWDLVFSMTNDRSKLFGLREELRRRQELNLLHLIGVE